MEVSMVSSIFPMLSMWSSLKLFHTFFRQLDPRLYHFPGAVTLMFGELSMTGDIILFSSVCCGY